MRESQRDLKVSVDVRVLTDERVSEMRGDCLKEISKSQR